MTRFRTVIDFDVPGEENAEQEEAAEQVGRLAYLQLKQVLANNIEHGDPRSATFHGVRALPTPQSVDPRPPASPSDR